jgi:4-amino-4-deoxy-L-arabinose transferase-like glycosyltransferase
LPNETEAAPATAAADQRSSRWDRVWSFVTRAIEGDALRWVLVLAGIALLARLPLIFNGFTSSIVPDSALYLHISDELLAGHGFVTDAYRTAGYPLFIAPLSLLPGPTTHAVVVAQHLLGVGLVAAVFWVGDRHFGRVAGIFAALLTALAPPIILTEHYLLPDFLFGLLVFAGAVVLLEAISEHDLGIRWLVATGVLFGLATNVKPAGQVLVAVAPVALLLITRSWRRALKPSLVIALTMFLTVLPWLLHNAIADDQFTLSIQGKQALWLRVFDEDKLPIPTDSDEGVLAQHLYEQYISNPPEGYGDPATLDVTESYSYVFNALGSRGYSTRDATDLMGDVAFDAIRSNPSEYIKGTIANVADYVRLNGGRNGFDPSVVTLQTARQETTLGSLGTISSVAWDLAEFLLLVGFVLSLALLAIPLLFVFGEKRVRIATAVFLITWLAIAVAGSLTANVFPRYAAQIAVLQWLPEAAAAVMVVGGLVAIVRRRTQAG